MRFGPRAIAIVNAVLLIAASSTSVLAQARTPTAAGLWEKLNSSGQPEAEFQIVDCNGLYQGKIVKIFPRPGENTVDLSVHGLRGRTEKRSGGGSHLNKRDAERGPRLSGRNNSRSARRLYLQCPYGA